VVTGADGPDLMAEPTPGAGTPGPFPTLRPLVAPAGLVR